jgi:hypothetical protein
MLCNFFKKRKEKKDCHDVRWTLESQICKLNYHVMFLCGVAAVTCSFSCLVAFVRLVSDLEMETRTSKAVGAHQTQRRAYKGIVWMKGFHIFVFNLRCLCTFALH